MKAGMSLCRTNPRNPDTDAPPKKIIHPPSSPSSIMAAKFESNGCGSFGAQSVHKGTVPFSRKSISMMPKDEKMKSKRAHDDDDQAHFEAKIPTQERPKVRHVLFKKQVRMKNIDRIEELSQDDIDSIWYSKQEYLQMKRKAVLFLERIKKEDMDDRGKIMRKIESEDDYCDLGLEGHTAHGRSTRQHLRKAAADAIFLEQEMPEGHKGLGEDRRYRLAQVYQAYSSQAQCNAQRRAVQLSRDIGSGKQEVCNQIR